MIDVVAKLEIFAHLFHDFENESFIRARRAHIFNKLVLCWKWTGAIECLHRTREGMEQRLSLTNILPGGKRQRIAVL